MANNDPKIDENTVSAKFLRYMTGGTGLDDLVATIHAMQDGPDESAYSATFPMGDDGFLGSSVRRERFDILLAKLGDLPSAPT